MTSKHPFDPDLVRELAMLVSESDLTEIEVEKGDLKIRVVRAPAQTIVHQAPMASVSVPMASASTGAPVHVAVAADVSAEVGVNPGTVKSPMVGTAYRRPTPEAKAFVEVGSVVREGDKILLIEAMKTFNDIVAPRAGTITQILVDDKDPVEFGQPLVVIE